MRLHWGHCPAKSHECHCELEWTFTAITPASEADDQMRRRFQQLLPNCPLSALYTILHLPSYPLQQWHRATSHSIPPLVCYRHRSGGTMGIRYARLQNHHGGAEIGGWIVLVVVLRWAVHPIPNYDRPVMIWYRQFILRWWTVVLRFIALVLELLKWLFRDPEVIPMMTTCVQQ